MVRILDLKPRMDAVYHWINPSPLDKNTEELIEKIRERFEKVDLSISAYDTAWVAMVTSALRHQEPCFPGCLEWILENQKADGSWGLNLSHPSLLKDSLSSTLACVIALQKWNVGEKHIQRGLVFIGSKKYAAVDKYQSSPIGFDINFPAMIKYANNLGLNLPLDSAFIDLMLHNRDTKLQRCKPRDLAYFAEGLVGESSYDWEEIIKNGQGSNGSLFNSPAATAAVLINTRNDKCYDYLNSLLKINHGKGVPTIYPFHLYTRLCMVDTIDRLGINRHFANELKVILDETYRCWLQKSEEIYSDVSCCSMAFRLLRKNRYHVSSDALEEFIDEEHFFSTLSPQFTNTSTVVQLHRASQMSFFQKEPVLDKINEWTTNFLRHQLLNHEIYDDHLLREVKYAFEYPIDNLPRLTNRRAIELYNIDSFRMLKTSYRCCSVNNEDFLVLSQQEFTRTQQIHLEEYKQVEEWLKKHRIGGLEFEWHMVTCAYFIGASSYIIPELSDVRIMWAKGCVVATIIDDLFDIDGTQEELLNIIHLIQNWDGNSNISSLDYSSERTEIMFLALTEIINEQAAIGLIRQGRCIKKELIQVWQNFCKSCFKDVEWWANKSTPTLDEYLANGCQTSGIGLWSTTFYFVGIQLSQDTLISEEYQIMYKHIGLIMRLFNDYQGVMDERDKVERKVNGCLLLVSLSGGALTIEEARTEVRKMIENSRKEVLRMMLTASSATQKILMESFFCFHQQAYYLYTGNDKYRIPSKKGLKDINGLLYEPLNLLPSYIREDKFA